METRFTGVSLGATVAGSKSWAHDLEVTIDDNGVAVAGEGTQSSALPWNAIKHFAPGFTLAFPDGRPATELEVTLPDRSLSFLVPVDQLTPAVLGDLVRFATDKSTEAQRQSAASGAGIPAPPQPPSSSPYMTPPPGAPVGAASGSRGAGLGQGSGGPIYRIDPKESQKPNKKGRHRLVAGIGAIVVAAVVAVVVIVMVGGNPASRVVSTNTTHPTSPTSSSTPTTKPPAPLKELSGPPMSMSPGTATAAVTIRGTDLKNWQVVQPGAQLVAGEAQELGGLAPGPSSPSLAGIVEPSFELLQQCANLPLDHLQLWTANYYAGGPPTYGTAYYAPKDVNVTQDVNAPEINAVTSEVSATSVQKADIGAMAAPSFTSCLQSFLESYLRSIAGQEGENVDDMKVTIVPTLSPPGVQTIDFDLSAELISNGNVTQIREQYVVMGAGRLEQIVISDEALNQPIPSGTWNDLIRLIQHRMQVVASKR
jgi:hypothetical protein